MDVDHPKKVKRKLKIKRKKYIPFQKLNCSEIKGTTFSMLKTEITNAFFMGLNKVVTCGTR